MSNSLQTYLSYFTDSVKLINSSNLSQGLSSFLFETILLLIYGFAVYVKEALAFTRDLSLEKSDDTSLRFRLASPHYLTFFSCISHRPLLFAVSNTVSSNIVKVISINPSAIVVVSDDFNNHPLDYWTNYGGTKRPVVLCYKFFISTDLTQTCNSPSRIIHRDSQSCSFGFIFNFRV